MRNQHVNKKLSAFIDDELNQEEREIVETHLEVCDSCREALEQLRTSWELLNDLPKADPSPHAYLKIKVRMECQKKERPLSLLERFLVPATTAAALILGVWVGSIVGKNGTGSASYGSQPIESEVYLETFDEIPSGSLAQVYIDLASVE